MLLLFLPERQQALRGRAADHAGNSHRHLAEGRRRDAAERERADTHLPPEIDIAPRLRPLGLELFDRGKRVLAHRAELHGVGGLDHLGQRRFERRRSARPLAPEKFAQFGIAHGVAGQGVARHAANGQLVHGIAALRPRQHLDDASDRHVRAGREIVAPQGVEQILVAGEGDRRIELLFFLREGILREGATQLVEHAWLRLLQRNVHQRRQASGEVAVDHHLPSRHFGSDLAQQVAPIRQARIGDRTHDYPFVLLRHGKEAVDELLGLGGVRSDRACDEPEIDPGILRLLERLRMKQHAHGRRNMRIVRLGAIIVDPLLNHAQRGPRVDVGSDRRLDRAYQHDQGGDEGLVTHMMLPPSVIARVPPEPSVFRHFG